METNIRRFFENQSYIQKETICLDQISSKDATIELVRGCFQTAEGKVRAKAGECSHCSTDMRVFESNWINKVLMKLDNIEMEMKMLRNEIMQLSRAEKKRTKDLPSSYLDLSVKSPYLRRKLKRRKENLFQNNSLKDSDERVKTKLKSPICQYRATRAASFFEVLTEVIVEKTLDNGESFYNNSKNNSMVSKNGDFVVRKAYSKTESSIKKSLSYVKSSLEDIIEKFNGEKGVSNEHIVHVKKGSLTSISARDTDESMEFYDARNESNGVNSDPKS